MDADAPRNRADEVRQVLDVVTDAIIPFIAAADRDATVKHTGRAVEKGRQALVEQHEPKELEGLLKEELEIREAGIGREGLEGLVRGVLEGSVNTWDQGFLDKLYASTDAIGLASELLLATLNTNAHIYTVSPALTLIEKRTALYLCSLFHLPSQTCGGISQPGGSASNLTAISIARNTLYPSTKTLGPGSHRFTLFTSAHGHYSIEKAALMLGLGTQNLISIPVDDAGRMIPSALEEAVVQSKERGETPFFVNATAGTTVLGSFDPLEELAPICRAHGLWLHVDGSWGGSVAFSPAHAASRLKGVGEVDSVTISPHKMLGVPLTCSFLLGRDMGCFRGALGVQAGYLFHGDDDESDTTTTTSTSVEDGNENVNEDGKNDWTFKNEYDLATLTPQCGRRADSLKLFLALRYHGAAYYTARITRAFETANYLLDLLKASPNFISISPEPLPCLQVCFYYAKGGQLRDEPKKNGVVTSRVAKKLVGRGFMVDFAPGERGKFFRVVVNGETRKGTVEGLLKAVEGAAEELGY